MAVYPRLDRLQRPGLVTNPGAAWHEKEAARVRVEWRKGPPGSRKQTYFAGLRDAHDYSAEVSRRRGTNPQVAFDPFDYATAAEAKRARDALYRQLRAAGHLRVRRSVLRGQLEKYRGLGVGGRGVRDVYYVTWEDPTLPSEARVFGHRQNPCQPVSTRINPRRPGTRSRAVFCPEQVAPKGRFDRRSFRTVVSDGHRVTVGCPKIGRAHV